MFKKIQKFIEEKTDSVGNRQLIAFGIILTINYPLYYFIWLYASSQAYENLFLRLSASFACLLLILKNYWPASLKGFLPIYWYVTVIYTLPFFFTFMTLHNNASTMWLMNSISALFFILLLFDLLSSIAILTIGIFLGWLCFYLTMSHPFMIVPGTVNLFGIISTIGAAFLIGAIFSLNREKIKNEKLQTIWAIGESIAHELRTPLRTISSGATGIKEHLPFLIDSYQIAKSAKLKIPYIDPMHYEVMKTILDNIESETDYAFKFIEMLLINAKPSKLGNTSKNCSIIECVDKALLRYPFDEKDRELIKWECSRDFVFKGDELLIIHVLFNLIKNAIYYIKASGKGTILISLEYGEKFNFLYFKDTGQGISAKILPKIFNNFFSSTLHGTGIGLSFCKMVLQNIGGNIACQSREGEYTEFILSFPAISQ